jgi:hypothetical protein
MDEIRTWVKKEIDTQAAAFLDGLKAFQNVAGLTDWTSGETAGEPNTAVTKDGAFIRGSFVREDCGFGNLI